MDEEGDPDFFWDVPVVEAEVVEEADETAKLPKDILRLAESNRQLEKNDIALAKTLVETDDDNLPVEENKPSNKKKQGKCKMKADWGHDGICQRRVTNAQNLKAKVKFDACVQPSILQLFEILLFKPFITSVIVPRMNESIHGEETYYGEFLVFLGLWLMMATIQGPTRRDYWSVRPVDEFDGAPFRFGKYMSRNRFEALLRSLRYTADDPPPYVDKFFEVRAMLKAFNEHMAAVFIPGWITCLDESMSFWTNKYTCPGFVFCPRKPWPFGNEYHTICCGLTGILFSLELVEGKTRPKDMRKPEYDDRGGPTVGLLLRLTKSMWGTGRAVVLDSGFCVLRAIIELKKVGVFSAALIKKRRYWPANIDGDAVKEHFEDKPIGSSDVHAGTLDDVHFEVHAMREPDYTMMMMATYGTLEEKGEMKKRVDANGNVISFRYPEIIHNHFQFRHAVDDHNNRRQSPISIEKTWATAWWPNRVFAFLIAVVEVNTYLAALHLYGYDAMEQL